MAAMGITNVHLGHTYFPRVFVASFHAFLYFIFSYGRKNERWLQLSKHITQKGKTERNIELINIPGFYSEDVQLNSVSWKRNRFAFQPFDSLVDYCNALSVPAVPSLMWAHGNFSCGHRPCFIYNSFPVLRRIVSVYSVNSLAIFTRVLWVCATRLQSLNSFLEEWAPQGTEGRKPSSVPPVFCARLSSDHACIQQAAVY